MSGATTPDSDDDDDDDDDDDYYGGGGEHKDSSTSTLTMFDKGDSLPLCRLLLGMSEPVEVVVLQVLYSVLPIHDLMLVIDDDRPFQSP